MIVEGESLLNDGTAVVVFRIIVGLGAGSSSAGELALGSLREFVVVVAGGIIAGAIVGLLASVLTGYFEDHLLEITLTTISAYGSFLLAESLHFSPVIAVLATGLLIGNYGRVTGMSPPTQVAVNSFWEYAAFVVNSLVFLLIGLEIQVTTLAEQFWPVAWGVAAMLAARVVSVFLLVPVSNMAGEKVPFGWQTVLMWGGLRGSLSIALVLSLPVGISGRAELVTMIFGAVIFSLLVQGLTIAPLLKLLGFSTLEPRGREQELVEGRILTNAASIAELRAMRDRGDITGKVFETLEADLAREGERLQALHIADEELEQRQLSRARLHLLAAKKSRLSGLFREGMLSEDVHQELRKELDWDQAGADPGNAH